jgi:hypothetical protein
VESAPQRRTPTTSIVTIEITKQAEQHSAGSTCEDRVDAPPLLLHHQSQGFHLRGARHLAQRGLNAAHGAAVAVQFLL